MPAPAAVPLPSPRPRAVTCAGLSLVGPGAGQIHGGRPRRGVAILAVVAALLAGAVARAAWAFGRTGILNALYGWATLHADRFPGRDPGATALKQVAANLTGMRARSKSSDDDRIRRQRCVLAEQADAARLLRAFPRIAGAARRNVRTPHLRRGRPRCAQPRGEVCG